MEVCNLINSAGFYGVRIQETDIEYDVAKFARKSQARKLICGNKYFAFFKFNRVFSPRQGSGQEAVIDKIWEEKTASNSRIYNASKFRLAEIRLGDANPAANPETINKFVLEVGITYYKELLGTHYCPENGQLMREAVQQGLGNKESS